jgi:hypothetical protein
MSKLATAEAQFSKQIAASQAAQSNRQAKTTEGPHTATALSNVLSKVAPAKTAASHSTNEA